MDTWKELDASKKRIDHDQLLAGDRCWHLREYLVDADSEKHAYELSDTNQIVKNFKMKPHVEKENPQRWKYKKDAIRLFAEELAKFPLARTSYFSSIPCSKIPGHPEFDDRLDQVLRKASALNPRIRIAKAVCRLKSIEGSHTQSGRRSPKKHEGSLAFGKIPDVIPGDCLFLLDDVLTSGSTFKACQQVIRAARSEITVYGVFWSRRMEKPDEDGDEA